MNRIRTLAQRVGHWLIGDQKKTGRRMYSAARNTRATQGFASSGNTSADSELHLSLTALRNRSRQMVRDSSYAKRAKHVVVNNVIGAGVGMQAQVGTTRAQLNERVNSNIEAEFSAWCAADSCHTGGRLHFHDIERAALGQVFEAGEVLIRMHSRRFGNSRVPMGLEVIEPERLAHEAMPGAVSADGDVRMGVELDGFMRPIAYWIRTVHPGDLRMKVGAVDRYERVPADEVFHLYVCDRWPQSRGEPWLHTAVRKLDELNEYTGLEVSAARGSAAYFATITTPEPDSASLPQDDTEGDKPVMDLEPLTIQELAPGEELQFHSPNRPNVALDPFMRAMLREVAAGVGVSYESLSRDYSQSNYSSSRLSLIDDREVWRVLQQWWIRAFRQPLHKRWLQQAVLARAVSGIPSGDYAADPAKFEAVLFKPRGWSWVDPTKEVNAYKEAIKAGFTTISDVIAATGGGQDIEDFIATRQRELAMLEAAGIEVDTTVPDPADAIPAPAPAAPAEPSKSEKGQDETTNEAASDGEAERLATIVEAQTRSITEIVIASARRDGRPDLLPPVFNVTMSPITVHLPEIRQGSITVHSPDITVQPADVYVPDVRVEPAHVNVHIAPTEVRVEPVTVNVPAQPAPEVRIEPAQVTVNVEPAAVTVAERQVVVNLPQQVAPTVNVEAPQVTVNVPEQQRGKRVRTVTAWTDDGLPKTVEEVDG